MLDTGASSVKGGVAAPESDYWCAEVAPFSTPSRRARQGCQSPEPRRLSGSPA
jgi:hypothetical protein